MIITRNYITLFCLLLLSSFSFAQENETTGKDTNVVPITNPDSLTQTQKELGEEKKDTNVVPVVPQITNTDSLTQTQKELEVETKDTSLPQTTKDTTLPQTPKESRVGSEELGVEKKDTSLPQTTEIPNPQPPTLNPQSPKDTSLPTPNSQLPTPLSPIPNPQSPTNNPQPTQEQWGFVSNVMEATFAQKEVVIEDGEIVTNVLRVVNKNGEKIVFYIDFTVPNHWKRFAKTDKWYEVYPQDSIFIPITLIPSEMQGNTNYLINVFIISDEQEQLANVYFLATQRLLSKWEVTTDPIKTAYFRYGQDTTSFSLNMNNIGNQEQNLKLSFVSKSKNLFVIGRNNEKYQNFRDNIIHLQPQSDTTLELKVKAISFQRNINKIDPESYRPQSFNIERKYNLMIQTAQVSNYGKGGGASTKLSFIKLPNERKVSEYAYGGIPLTVQTDIFGIMSSQTSINMLAYGQANMDDYNYFIYRYQFPVTSVLLSRTPFNFWYGSPYLGYFFKNGNVQVGNVGSSGIIGGGGNGISAQYRFTKQHGVSAFYTRNPDFFSGFSRINYGLSYQYTPTFTFLSTINVGYSHRTDDSRKVNSDLFATSFGVRFLKTQSLSLSVFGGNSFYYFNPDSTFTRFGYRGTVGYGGSFFKNKLHLNANTIFGSKYLEGAGSSQSTNINASCLFPRDWSASFGFNFSKYEPIDFANGKFISIPGSKTESYTLSISNPRFLGRFAPSGFWIRNITPYISTLTRGMAIFYGYNDMDKHFKMSFTARGGFINLLDYPKIPSIFTLQINNMYTYRTFSFYLRYFYGPYYSSEQVSMLNGNTLKPQTLRLSFGYNYLFPREQFLLNLTSNYRYNNLLENHTVSIIPTLYYFTFSGWRLHITTEYFFSYGGAKNSQWSNSSTFYNVSAASSEDNPESKLSQSININMGIKKDFLIPILGRKHFNLDIIAFIDINGNGKKDGIEDVLRDVIVRVGDWEVITNERGTAKITNVPLGNYKTIAIPFDELNGWFPFNTDTTFVIKDQTLFIPFVKGVKVYGNIVLDREKLGVDADKPFDLSKIRMTAVDSAGKAYSTLTGFNGEFQLYVPIGKYTIMMNEQVLGDRFKLIQNNIPLHISKDLDNIFISFYIIERKRKVVVKKFGNGNGNVIKKVDTLLSKPALTPVPAELLPLLKKGTPLTPTPDNKPVNNNIITEPVITKPQEQPKEKNNPEKNVVTPSDNQSRENRDSAPLNNQQLTINNIPPNAPSTEGATPSEFESYYVQPGNSLKDIYTAYNMTVEEIRTKNKLTSDKLTPGQLLKVKRLQPPAGINYELITITVKPGQTIYGIYKVVDMTVEEIMQLNNLKTDKLKAGQVLRVKKKM